MKKVSNKPYYLKDDTIPIKCNAINTMYSKISFVPLRSEMNINKYYVQQDLFCPPKK